LNFIQQDNFLSKSRGLSGNDQPKDVLQSLKIALYFEVHPVPSTERLIITKEGTGFDSQAVQDVIKKSLEYKRPSEE
jgi:hypothetical protein